VTCPEPDKTEISSFFVKRASFTGIEQVKKFFTQFNPDFTVRGNFLNKYCDKAGLIRLKCCQNIFCSTMQSMVDKKKQEPSKNLVPEISVVENFIFRSDHGSIVPSCWTIRRGIKRRIGREGSSFDNLLVCLAC
jgi:hypothetical protein